jgi:hypothetical protein
MRIACRLMEERIGKAPGMLPAPSPPSGERVGVRGLEQGQHARVRQEAWDTSPIGPQVLPLNSQSFQRGT